ncbi:single-stranded DNA-binding protein [Streptomyces sp. HNM0574]|uniref:single-stranded DNA-binding protein n=1 Tax=Streptomyces sp. HNM0574 TaxID=2714954 RepID=UPI00146D89BF|nr:single-stranded DNA-binding protein [Streptomyces sp. HNM0574]NLU66423.1 single-stranded DNA-binding protein [Streptomyces sp. HNM0574]
MRGTPVTVVGNVATAVDFRAAAGGVPCARFRLACTARRFDRQRNEWADAGTSFYTVWAWRTLASNLASSVSVGEPVVVHGQLRIREDEAGEVGEGDEKGRRRFLSAEIAAWSVGHDLTRGTAAFVRVVVPRPELVKGARRPEAGGRSSSTGPGITAVTADG